MSASAAPSGLVAGLDVLQRAIDYLLAVLAAALETDGADLPERRGDLPTPCAAWSLDDLLGHVEDSLDAFTEAATGRVRLSPAPGCGGTTPARLRRLQVKGGGLVRAWLEVGAAPVTVGERRIGAALVARIAALEVAVHAWDIGVAITPVLGPSMSAARARLALPEPLAVLLLPEARRVAGSAPGAFAAPVPVPDDAPTAVRLVAALGRDPAQRP
ncbi:maleylpyruvate isomerase N-terminal domain-containing protein [Nocardioides sp. zg-536]|uniref:Maleylpyruvate isomerase N-terminal domain-containing protein n=1 Tax=Nocardioides faecalis TaxID=2803858 RepID=A0A938Y3Z0_9ACTN|nr:maleylpyruvate isomerase N-terminal domain-containing protein [Nocardioides faecalis]MBM9458737.1 maleylpyruvate isomerase N-terminal domain-containing protein [Nocardioides faecalis]QVI58721.1 maleylpyruvate isomerase N-terminal domain-containing protein [Nocardioides faecalis]